MGAASGQPATGGSASVLLVDVGAPSDVFELIDLTDSTLVARSPFLFEIGEELNLRLDRDGSLSEITARVRSHRADGTSELEILDQSEPRRAGSG
ncbi:hypothetical protein BH11MYX1_BH11MYX1_24480 [soil metagenome]